MAKYPGDAEVDRVVMENTKGYRAKHGRDEPLRGDEPEWLLASIKRVRAKLGPVGQPRPKARQAAAAAEISKPVKLSKDPSAMKAADRIRYYLGLPQGYQMKPSLAKKAMTRLKKDLGYSKEGTGSFGHEGAFSKKPSRFEELLFSDLDEATKPGASDTFGEFSVSRELGFRDPGETMSKARGRARKAAAKRPHNPRMGQTKRKYGSY